MCNSAPTRDPFRRPTMTLLLSPIVTYCQYLTGNRLGYTFGTELRQKARRFTRSTMLYRLTDGLSRRGAPVKNLTLNASLGSCVEIAPSKSGIKHLERSPIMLDRILRR